MIVLEDVFVEPRDHVGNAAWAQLQIGHFQAVQLEQLAAYAHATEGDEFAYLEVARGLLLHTCVYEYQVATSGAGSDADRAGP